MKGVCGIVHAGDRSVPQVRKTAGLRAAA